MSAETTEPSSAKPSAMLGLGSFLGTVGTMLVRPEIPLGIQIGMLCFMFACPIAWVVVKLSQEKTKRHQMAWKHINGKSKIPAWVKQYLGIPIEIKNDKPPLRLTVKPKHIPVAARAP